MEIISPKIFIADGDIRQKIKDYRATEDPAILNELVGLFGKYVSSIARNYQTHGLELCDLIANGMIGLIHIITNTFDVDGPTKFVTYANAVLSRYMREALDEKNNVVRLPKNIRNDIRWVRQISNNLEGKGATFKEVLKAVKAEADIRYPNAPDNLLDRLYSYIDYGTFTQIALDVPLGDDLSIEPIDLIGSYYNEAESNLKRSDAQDQVQAMLKTRLTQREQDVIQYYFFGTVALEYIKKTYNIGNAERVRQIRDIALNKLRQLDLDNLAELIF